MDILKISNYLRSAVTLSIILMASLVISNDAISACTGCNQIINLTLNETLGFSGNTPGYSVKSSNFTINSIDTGYGYGYKSTSFTGIDGTIPPYGTAPSDWVYQKVDDYFSVAVRSYGACGYRYPPYNQAVQDVTTCLPAQTNGRLASNTWESSIRVDKTMIGGTYSRNILLGTWGGCSGYGCQIQDNIYARIYLSYSITVPQNCVINAGEIMTVDFGNIPSTAFVSAPGQRAKNVTPISRAINMQCNNISPSSLLAVRVQANKVSGNAIVSDNPDVGFVISGSNGELTPNKLSSTIPFSLNSANSASVPVSIWPVSVTGKKPAEGRVTALGFVRVDFQ